MFPLLIWVITRKASMRSFPWRPGIRRTAASEDDGGGGDGGDDNNHHYIRGKSLFREEGGKGKKLIEGDQKVAYYSF